jgi:hypothetical protein
MALLPFAPAEAGAQGAWVPTFVGMYGESARGVTHFPFAPAEAGGQCLRGEWAPACAGVYGEGVGPRLRGVYGESGSVGARLRGV